MVKEGTAVDERSRGDGGWGVWECGERLAATSYNIGAVAPILAIEAIKTIATAIGL